MQSSATPSRRGSSLLSAWFALTLAVLGYAFRQAMVIAPTECTMGNVQRIFYWHVPSAMLGLIFPCVNFFASVAFLYFRRRNPQAALTADLWAVSAPVSQF